MYVLVVYDVDSGRVARVCKYLRRFLSHVQNSVFEGELTVRNLNRVQKDLAGMIDLQEDSVLLYILRDQAVIRREKIGVEKRPITNIL